MQHNYFLHVDDIYTVIDKYCKDFKEGLFEGMFFRGLDVHIFTQTTGRDTENLLGEHFHIDSSDDSKLHEALKGVVRVYDCYFDGYNCRIIKEG